MADLQEQMTADALEAQKLTRKFFVVELDFSLGSLAKLDDVCDDVEFAMKGGKSEENVETLSRAWGAYVGEVIRRACDGQWNEGPLLTAKGHELQPHEHVRRRLIEGQEHHLAKIAEHLD